MKKWRENLYAYTGLFITFGIWTPLGWFIVSSRHSYNMESFEVLSMNWFGILEYVVLLAATLVAQFGFILIAEDLSELERMKRNRS